MNEITAAIEQDFYRWVKASEENLPKEFGLIHFRDLKTKHPITAGTAYTLIKRKDYDFEWLEKVEADQQELWREVYSICQNETYFLDKLSEQFLIIPKQ